MSCSRAVRTDAFDYELPEERIAQVPAEPRDSARMLVDRGAGAPPEHLRVRDLPRLLGPGDLVVLNDTRVAPARLEMTRATGGRAELLLLEDRGDGSWEALVRPGRRLRPGTELCGPLGLRAVVTKDLGHGRRVVKATAGASLQVALRRAGKVPLPPYIAEPLGDPERYQTVYSRRAASTAAPTAGLHLTSDLLERTEAAGAELARIELVIGIDTFRPISAERVEDHPIHSECYCVAPEVMRRCCSASRVIAVGTTTVRALEAAAATGRLAGRTDLFIRGEYDFRVVDVLLTNFHFPRSSLLVMIEAFVGPRWRELYATALADDYRFLSFGDAMLLDRHAPQDRG